MVDQHYSLEEESPDPAMVDEFLATNGILDLNMTLQQRADRYNKFKGVSFGVAPKEVWPTLMQ